MRVKEIDRTANVAWSPENKFPIYIATGTAAQQLDATFSTSSSIELYSLGLDEATLDMPLVASVNSDVRFHKIVWGKMKDTESGYIIGGSENGSIHIYSADKMLANSEDCLVAELTRHVGAVKALDLNPFQPNLLASGAGDSEIYIWDLLKTDNPMTPGQKSQPPEELACVAWNRQVQHILGSTFGSRSVVWDLRKNEPIIKISDSMSRIKAKLLAWHPEVATQLCLSSEDDHTPVIQVWDLRYATSPLKVLESHKKGVLSIDWCQRDPDLLLSCGKDSRILCWNPNSNVSNGEVVYELNTNNQWCFDIQWCPRSPAIISTASFDGHITLYSLMGGGHPIQPSNKVAESFGGVPVGSAPVQVPYEEDKVLPLQKPPKWIRKPVGASFSFGGKLVTFGVEASPNPQQPPARVVRVSQVVTETNLVVRSNALEQALSGGQFAEFCAMKAANSGNNVMQENVWNFMRVNFENEPRMKFLQLLGYDQNELARKVVEYTGTEVAASGGRGVDAQELAQKMSLLNTGSIMKADRLTASGQASPNVGAKTPEILDNLPDGSAAFDEIGSQAKLSGAQTPLVIPTDNADGLMTQALLTGNFEAAVEMCLSEDKMAEAILLAIAGGPELLIRTQKKYFQKNKSTLGRLISSVVTHDWAHIVENCDLDNWKEALAVVLTYALPEEFSALCDTLATRLETERDGALSLNASLCYVCSGNVEKLVENWIKNTEDTTQPLALQDLVEKVMVLRKAVEVSRGTAPAVSGGALAEKLSQYAGLLAAQGSLSTALTYLNNSSDHNLALLQDRLRRAIDPASARGVAPPFAVVNVLPEGAAQPQQQVSAVNSRPGMRSSALAKTATPGYQTVSGGGNFQTTPTSAANYYNPGIGSKYPSYPQAPSIPTYDSSGYPSQNYAQPNFSQPQPYFSQPQQFNNQPNTYSPLSHQPAPAPQPSMFNPMNTGVTPAPYVPPVATSQAPPAMYSYQDKPAETAWNDPPIVQEKQKPVMNYSNTTPANILTPQPVGNADRGPPGAPAYQGLYNPMEHQVQAPAPAPEPPKPVEKGPIPTEHQVLQGIFDKLVKSCAQVAPNAQMKRKLEDVSRKLEILYDKLRENMLSQTVLMGLHQIVQAIQQYDYGSGLNVYTGMVSHGNFSEISTFMPAIKVLLQSAMQLQVYVQ